MRVIYLFFGLVMFLGLSTGCKDSNKYDYEIAVIDSLQISLDEVVLKYKDWDIDSMITLKHSMDNELNYLTKILKQSGDTLEKEDGLFLGDYKSTSKIFKRVKENDLKFVRELDISNEQLAVLKKDIQNGAIYNADSVKTYLKKEKESVSILINGLSRTNKLYSMGLEKYAKMNPRVTDIIDSLSKRNNN